MDEIHVRDTKLDPPDAALNSKFICTSFIGILNKYLHGVAFRSTRIEFDILWRCISRKPEIATRSLLHRKLATMTSHTPPHLACISLCGGVWVAPYIVPMRLWKKII